MLHVFKQSTAPDQLTVDAVLRLREQMKAALIQLEQLGSFRRGKRGWHDFWLAVGGVRVLIRNIEIPSCRDETPDTEIQLLCDGAGCIIPLRDANAEVIGFNLRTFLSGDQAVARFCLHGDIVEQRRVHTGYIAHDASKNPGLMFQGVKVMSTLLADFVPARLPAHGSSYYLH